MSLDIILNIEKYLPFDGSNNERLSIKFSGKDINNKIVNALRRISCKYVPTYAFSPENITITKNTSNAFNNDMIKLRLSTLPIFNIDPNIDILHEKYWKNGNKEKHPSEKYIAGFINITNKTPQIVNVTTHDIVLKIDGENSDVYKKTDPIILIKLNPNNIFTCSMIATLGIGYMHDNWSALQNGYFDIQPDGSIILTIETAGKINLFDILIRSCNILINKLQLIKEELNNKSLLQYNDNSLTFELIDEDISFGDIINYELQSSKNIIFSGISKPDLLKNIVYIKTNIVNNDIIHIIDCLNNLINKIEYIKARIIVIRK